VLGLLAKYSGDEATKRTFLEETDTLASYLARAPRRTEESYVEWAWWVDNVDAYAALELADAMAGDGRHTGIITAWIAEVRTSLDASGNILAEAYGPYVKENQSRSPASAWMIPYLRLMDADFAREQADAFDRAYASTFLGMPVMLEVPAGQSLVNRVATGPVIFGASSAGTLLGLAAYDAMGESERAKALERTVRAAFFYDRESGSICFGVSTLLESTLYWAESLRK
jgi:hypothetical protein